LHVGRVLDALERTGFAENTIVVLLSDHGEEFMDHGGVRHGHTLHRELVRVPLAIRAPGIAPARVAELVRTVDVMPTLLELVGLEPPEEIAGRSLVARMRGQPLEELPALAEIALSELLTMDCVIAARAKLVDHPLKERRELYDLSADLLEMRDVHAERPAETERLAALLAELKESAGARARASSEIVLTPGQAEDLRKLGYGGELGQE
jgi:arylsulfatase A-like enzyme